MRKRDKLRAKRDLMWEKMEDNKAKRKAEGGLAFLVVTVVAIFGLQMCAPDYSFAASKVRKVKVTKVRKIVKKKPMNLSKRNVAMVGSGAAVVGIAAANSQKKKEESKKPARRQLGNGYFEQGNKVCKRKYGQLKCKSKAAYYFDDVLDADDWFDDDDEYYQPRQNQLRASDGTLSMWFMFMFVVIFIIALCAILPSWKRRR